MGITRLVDDREGEGGSNNVTAIALRSTDFTSTDYHDYLHLGTGPNQDNHHCSDGDEGPMQDSPRRRAGTFCVHSPSARDVEAWEGAKKNYLRIPRPIRARVSTSAGARHQPVCPPPGNEEETPFGRVTFSFSGRESPVPRSA